ncbi:MAG: hypothetical protein AAFW89_02975 [Bacteroidota bacterium]
MIIKRIPQALTLILSGLILFAACSKSPEPSRLLIEGTLTVADSIDATGDYSGIALSIVNETDTLLYIETDSSGMFSAELEFESSGIYPLQIGRNGVLLWNTRLMLADNDTIHIEGQLPDFSSTLTIDSRENRALEVYNRLTNQYQRVLIFIENGQVADSLVPFEFSKWSDLFWNLYEERSETLAGKLSAGESIRILNMLNPSIMEQKVESVLPEDFAFPLALNYVKPLKAKQGLLVANRYLDSLITLTEVTELKRNITMDKIKLNFDSSRVDDAMDWLDEFDEEHTDEMSTAWAKNMRYDLTYLAPGVAAPDFSFLTLEGDSVSRESLLGSAYILEISPLASPEYQQQYDRTVVIYQIYKNYGLKMFTLPLDASPVTVNAFFEERSKLWSVASNDSFDPQQLIETFNITRIPTRLLVDQNGVIVKKYVAEEFNDVIPGLNKILNQNPES